MTDKSKQALALAMSLKKKAQGKSHGGKCYACGGVVNPELEESHMSNGGQVEEPSFEGGGVDDSYDAESVNDTDGDNDDLVFSPEVEPGEVNNEEDNGAKFLKAYMVSRKMRTRA